MKSTTYPYHVVLVPKTKHKKGNESGINYPGELKTSNSSRGHKISTRNSSVIGSDLTYKFDKLGSLFARCVRFEKLNKSDLPPSTTRASPFHPRYISAFLQSCQMPTPQYCQPHPLVPNLAASTYLIDKIRTYRTQTPYTIFNRL
jgi:hypothetical protein